MEKFQVQFIVGPFAVNHIAEEKSLESAREKYFSTYTQKESVQEEWIIDDALIKVDAISMIRVTPYVEPTEPAQPEA